MSPVATITSDKPTRGTNVITKLSVSGNGETHSLH
jgi:hypothetical protein